MSKSRKSPRGGVPLPGPASGHPCPVVAIGASAGGFEAFQEFFENMPADSGVAFVLVQHLDPQHETLMPDLLARHTSMKVLRLDNCQKLLPNHIFVVPPAHDVHLANSVFTLSPATATDRKPIDQVFRSIAHTQHENLIAIILTGTGTDGTLGLHSVKTHGGLTIVQSPNTAKFDGMPRSALESGAADLVLPISEMPPRIVACIRHHNALHSRKDPQSIEREAASFLPSFCKLLRKKTGHDFSQYKQATLVRRIQRRMQLLYLDSPQAYLELLSDKTGELDALFKDLLIGVTQFFRDPDSFEALVTCIFPELFRGKSSCDTLRVWVPGCATGEEAYTLAILLAEYAASLKKNRPAIQIFATDIDSDALNVARKARYPLEIAGQISAKRLKRFFKKIPGGYEVQEAIRDLCVFSPHNLIKDPPFSRLDLLSCRNVLIYFEADLQKKLLPVFHYALNPSGCLFLGPSENLPSRGGLFHPVSAKFRIFQRKPSPLHISQPLPLLDPGQITRSHIQPPVDFPSREQPLARAIERVILEDYAPPSAVINAQGHVLYFSGNTARYLQPPAGAPTHKLASIVHKSLRLELRTALHRAITSGQEILRESLEVKIGKDTQLIDLVVRPLAEVGKDAGLYIVVFRELVPSKTRPRLPAASLPIEDHPFIRQLESELRTTREDLQITIEELETSNEELKSANEELLSTNEELQSSNEELQTSKEELQAANDELNRKIEEVEAAAAELRRAHEDRARLAAIVHYSDDAIIGKTLDGVVTSWNPAAERVFGYTAAEMVGQSILKLIPPERHSEESGILDQLRRGQRVDHFETVRRRKDGALLDISLSVSPLRDSTGRIIGAAKIARDITGRKLADEARFRLAALVESSEDAIISKTLEGIVTTWNKGAERIFGYTASEIIGRHITTLFPPDRLPEEDHVISRIRRGEPVEHFETIRKTKDGRLINISLTVSPIRDPLGKIIGASKIARDITAQKKTEAAYRHAAERLHLAMAAGGLGDWSWDCASDAVTLSPRSLEIFNLPPGQPVTWASIRNILHEDDRERARAAVETALAQNSQYSIEYRIRKPAGGIAWIAARGRGTYTPEGAPVGMIGVVQDISERKRTEDELREQTRILELLHETGSAIAAQLNLEKLVQQVTDAATKLSGAKFGAFFYNVINAQGESFLLYTLSGAPREAFEHFGIPRATPLFSPTFHGEGTIVCDDVLQDPRYGQWGPHHGMPKGHLPVRSYLAVAVRSRGGEVLGGLFFGHPEPGVFTNRTARLIEGVAAQTATAIDNARLYEAAQKEISERKRLTDELEKARELLSRHAEDLESQVAARTSSLTEALAQLEEFSYSVSHDLRAPVRAISGYTELLSRDFGPALPPESLAYLDKIARAASRMERLVSDILSVSRLARSEIQLTPVALQPFIQQIVELNPSMQPPHADLSVETTHSVLADHASLGQAISNLLSNAIKFVPEGAKPVVRVRSEPHGDFVRIVVEDHGIGVPERYRAKLFGMFQRLPDTIKYEGTGIGLAIVRKAVERMGGAVGMEPNQPQGSRFWIDLKKP